MAEIQAQWMHRDDICTTMQIDTEKGYVGFRNHTDDPLLCAFGTMESPVHISELHDLLTTRYMPERGGVEELTFKECGLRVNPTLEEILRINKGMIVDDFFWIKEADDPSTFRETRNRLGLTPKETFISLEEIKSKHFSYNDKYGIPALITRASQDKWIHKGWFVKEDTAGYESVTEVVARILARHIKNPDIDCLEYVLCPLAEDGNGICASPIYTDMLDIEFVTFWDILNKYGYTQHLPLKYEYNGRALLNCTINAVSQATGLNMEPYIKHMLMFDALILNPDRHYNNMAVMRKADGTYTLMPLYDHGLGLNSMTRYARRDRKITARIYSKSFNRYIGLAGDEYKLEIDLYGLYKELKEKQDYYREQEGYYADAFRAAIKFLLQRISSTQHIIWYPSETLDSQRESIESLYEYLTKDLDMNTTDTRYEYQMEDDAIQEEYADDKMTYGNQLRKE